MRDVRNVINLPREDGVWIAQDAADSAPCLFQTAREVKMNSSAVAARGVHSADCPSAETHKAKSELAKLRIIVCQAEEKNNVNFINEKRRI
jgi:hypothetical protein